VEVRGRGRPHATAAGMLVQRCWRAVSRVGDVAGASPGVEARGQRDRDTDRAMFSFSPGTDCACGLRGKFSSARVCSAREIANCTN
jgi:hypothetical protein